MQYIFWGQDNTIVQLTSAEKIEDAQSALDLIMSLQYETRCNKMILDQACFADLFFDLRSGLAGDILQKFVNYHIHVAIVGDYSGYTSQSLKDFIYESNRGKHVYFAASVQEAVAKLDAVTV